MNLQQFINHYKGRAVDYDGAYGAQCTDIIKFYMRDVLKTRVTGGHAKKMLGNLNSEFTKFYPPSIPKAGDIITWDWGTYGHVAIVISADANSITVFEQNRNDRNDPCQISTYSSYKSVQGYGRHKSLMSISNQNNGDFWNHERPYDTATEYEINLMLERKFGANANIFNILSRKYPNLQYANVSNAILLVRAATNNNYARVNILSRQQVADVINSL